MKVVILAGGKGTRISEEKQPKPMVEVGGKPIIWHIMNIYATSGYREFLVACGIDSMSVSPDSFIAVKQRVAQAEARLRKAKAS